MKPSMPLCAAMGIAILQSGNDFVRIGETEKAGSFDGMESGREERSGNAGRQNVGIAVEHSPVRGDLVGQHGKRVCLCRHVAGHGQADHGTVLGFKKPHVDVGAFDTLAVASDGNESMLTAKSGKCLCVHEVVLQGSR
jgi:hypothetical protein